MGRAPSNRVLSMHKGLGSVTFLPNPNPCLNSSSSSPSLPSVYSPCTSRMQPGTALNCLPKRPWRLWVAGTKA